MLIYGQPDAFWTTERTSEKISCGYCENLILQCEQGANHNREKYSLVHASAFTYDFVHCTEFVGQRTTTKLTWQMINLISLQLSFHNAKDQMPPIAQTHVWVFRPSQHLNYQLPPNFALCYQRQLKFKAISTRRSLIMQI